MRSRKFFPQMQWRKEASVLGCAYPRHLVGLGTNVSSISLPTEAKRQAERSS